jgi:hypothetical protein
VLHDRCAEVRVVEDPLVDAHWDSATLLHDRPPSAEIITLSAVAAHMPPLANVPAASTAGPPNAIRAVTNGNPAPSVATITQPVPHARTAADGAAVAAVARTSKEAEPARSSPVTRRVCAASSDPQPRLVAIAAEAHSESHTFPPTAKPVTSTSTTW